jgi:hypothetical protein
MPTCPDDMKEMEHTGTSWLTELNTQTGMPIPDRGVGARRFICPECGLIRLYSFHPGEVPGRGGRVIRRR